MIIVNFKTYPEGTGKNAVKLAKIISKYNGFYVAVQPADISRVVGATKKVLAQHIDPINPGRGTGYILPESVKSAGAVGTLINHSEHRISLKEVGILIERCRELKLRSVVCVKNIREALKVLKFKPSVIAYEEPKLIGTGIPITGQTSKIQKFIRIFRKKDKVIPVLCGAGISHAEDMRIAVREGYEGVLVASSIVKSKNPEKLIKEFSVV